MDGEVKSSAPMPPKRQKAPHVKESLTGSNGSAPTITEDTMEDNERPIIIDGKIDLTVTLPGEKTINANVDASMAMMDLLVHIAAKNRLSPAGHVIKVPSPYPGDDPIQFKPNTLIGDLGVTEIQIVPKRAPEPKVPVKKVAKFEKTVRLTVYLSKSNKFLVRVNPDKPLVELLPQICEEHGTVSTFFTLRLLHKPDEEMDLSKTLSDYKLPQNELSLVDLRGPQPVVADMPKEKKKKSIFGFKSTTKKKQKGDTDTESVKSGPTQQPPSSGLTVTQVRASPAPSPKPLRPPPPLAGAVALPIIDGSHLRKQQTAPQHQNAAPPPAPPQPPARKRPAPRPPSVTPRQSVKEPPVEIQVQPVHVDTIQKTTDNGLLENRIVIGEESHELILDNTSATPASLSSHSSLPSSPSHGPNTSNNIAPVNVPVHNESGTLKKRKAPPPPKPPQPVTKSGSPPVAAKRVPPQPPMRHQRQTSTGSTVSAGSDSSGGNRIDSSPSATPPTTIERPTRPVRRDHSPTRLKAVPPPPPVQPTVILDPSLLANKTEAHTEGVAYRKRSSKPTKPPRPLTYAGEVLVENTKSRRPCSFIAPPPPEEPPSPETVPEDIDKLIQEGRLSVAIVRDDTGADTEDSSESEKSASLSLSSGSTQSAISSSRSDEHTEDQDSTNKEKSQITEMLDHMINAEEIIKVTGSTDDIEADDDSRDDSGIVEASPPLVSPRKLKQQSTDDSEDDELTEEEARIIANLELEDDEDEEVIEKDKKSTNEGESSATESEDIALKSMMMKLSIEDISNDTTNYSPTTEHEEEFMLEEKLISQIAYKVDRHPLPDSHGIKVQRSEELVKERDITTPEPESTESQLGEEMEQKEEKEKMVPKDDVITITKNVEVEKKLDKTEIKPVEEEEIKTKDDAVPVVTTTASTTAGTAQSEGQSNQLQEQFALLQQQYAALQQQMITSQQAVLQQQQQQIASVSQLPPQATATMSAPMMMQQPAVMMQPVMTPQQQQYQQQMLMQQQMMQYMGMQQPMIVPVASTPQMMTYPQPIVQQPVMIPPQSSQQLVVGSPPRVVQQMMVGSPPHAIGSPPQATQQPVIGSPPQATQHPVIESSPQTAQPIVVSSSHSKTTGFEPEADFVEVESEIKFQEKEISETPKQRREFGMNLDSQGNIIRNPRHTVHTLDDLDISNTWFGSRNRSSSNPPEVDDAKDSLVNRPRAGTIETSSPDAPKTNTHTERKIVIINAAKKMEEEKPKDVLTIQQTKLKEPDRPKVIIQPAKPKEEEKPKVIIQQAKYKDEPKKGFIIDSKPLPKQTFSRPAEPKKKIVLVENTAAEPTVKPKDVKPTRDILIIENSTTSAPAPAAAATTTATVTASTTTPHNPDTEQSRPGYSKFAAHAAIPKAKVPRSGHSEVQIRHLYSPREDELLATRESTSVSKLRSMFGGNKS